MSEKKRSAEEYAALADAIEDGDYEVVGPVTVHRGRPRKGEEREAMRATSVRLPETTLTLLEEFAAADHTTTSELIRAAADEYAARRLNSTAG